MFFLLKRRLTAVTNLQCPLELLATTSINNNPFKGYTNSNGYVLSSENLRKPMIKRYESADPIATTFIKNTKRIRSMSTLHNQLDASAGGAVSQDEIQEFMAVFPGIIRDINEITSKYNSKESSEWFARVLEYNLGHGKKSRGLLTALTYKSLVPARDLSPENMRLAYTLGWCVELLHAFFLVIDDVMDKSITRRGRTCWYKLKGVGLTAINDGIMMENFVFELLKKHFRNTNCYIDLIEEFHESTYITICGQNLDLLNAEKATTTFSMEKYKTTVMNKTSHYSFYLPFALAMHFAGIKDPESFRQAKSILYEIGNFFQIQDDFIDCYGNPEVTGKIGTDIQDNKCSWLAVVCMQRANDNQKHIMLECYGKNDPLKVQRIKDLYKEMDMENIYSVYEEESYNMIKSQIEQMTCAVPQELFLHVLNKIYKRNA